MRTKLIVTLLCFATANITFAKSAETTESNKPEIIFWHVDSDLPAELITSLSEEFSKAREYKITPVYKTFEEVKGALIAAAMQKNAPDVALVPSDFVGLAQQMQLSAFDDTLINKNVNKVINETTMLHGVQYGAPITGSNHLALFYNKKFIKNPASTWEEIVSQSEELAKKDIKPIGWNYKEPYWLMPFLGAFGGWPMDGSEITLNTNSMRDTLTFYKNLSERGLVPNDCGYDCAFDRFIQGEFAYAINGTWAYRDIEKALGDNFGVAVLPSIDGKPMTPMFSSHALIFPGDSLNSEKGEVLKSFVSYMQSEQVQYEWFNKTGRLPVLQRVANKLKGKVDDNTKNLFEQQKTTREIPTDPSMAFAWEGIRKGLERHSFGTANNVEAASIMQRLADKEKVAAADAIAE